MPIYTIQAPDGRIADVEGDAPPTESDMQSIFQSLPPKSSAPQSPLSKSKESGIFPEENLTTAESVLGGLKNVVMPGATIGEYLSNLITGKAPSQIQRAAELQGGAAASGALNTLTAGISDAIAKKAGVPITGREASGTLAPISTSIGEIGGAFIPIGGAAAPSTAAQALRQGATIGGTYGAGGGIAQSIENPDQSSLENVIKGGLSGAALGSVLSPLGYAATNKLAPALEESALNKIKEGLLRGGGSKPEKVAAEKIAPKILDRPFSETAALTSGQLEEKSALAKQAAGEAIDAFGQLKGNANPQDVVSALEKLKDPHIVAGKSINDQAIARIEGVQDVLRQYGNNLTQEELRAIRRAFDKDVAEGNGFFGTLDEKSLLNIKKAASNKIRQMLADANPDLAPLNAEFNFWSTFNDLVSSANQRRSGKSGLMPQLATVGAVLSGGSPASMVARGTAASAINKALQSPAWKFTDARLRKKLADAISAGDGKMVNETAKAIEKLVPSKLESPTEEASQ